MITFSAIVSIGILFTNIFLAFLGKNFKYILPLLLLLMWILIGGSKGTADYENYLLLYEQVANTGSGFFASDVGFVAIMNIANHLGLSFNEFLMVISFVGLSLIYLTIKRYSNKFNYILSIYFIYPFLLDIVQIRHFLAMSIVIYTMRFAEEKNDFRFIIGIVIAASIHFSAALFLPFFIFYRYPIKIQYFIVIAVIIGGLLIIKTPYLLLIISYIVNTDKLVSYFENRVNLGYLVQIAIQLAFLAPLYFLYKHIKMRKIIIVDLVYKLNIYALMMIPIYMINLNSNRVFRMLLILNFIVYIVGFFKMGLKSTNKYILFFYTLILSISMFFYVLVGMSELSLVPIFNNNIYLN